MGGKPENAWNEGEITLLEVLTPPKRLNFSREFVSASFWSFGRRG
jgi:hypothetical protein